MAGAGRPEYPLFDWLRFGLASVVVISHSGEIRWESAGNLAVQVFFALSGWLIGRILIETHPKDLPRFYFNRVTRIWIPYFFTVFALYTISALRDPVNERWFLFLFYDVTFTHNWFSLWPDAKAALAAMPQKGTGNHFWSIAVEEQFYAVAPLLMLRNRFGRCWQLWLGISLLLWAFQFADFASVAFGVVAACYARDDRTISPFVVLPLAFVSSALLGSFYWYAAPVFAVSIVLLLARDGKRGTIGEFFGGVSYPLYLNAWMAGYVMNGLFHHPLNPSLGFKTVGSAVAVFIAAILYILIDRNVLAHRHAWFTQKTGTAAMISTYTLLCIGLGVGLCIRFQPS